MLHLRLLGSPEVRLDGKVLSELTSRKSLALLFYVAMTGRSHLRDELASLFWYEMPDTQARKNLRNILPVLRMLLGPHLTITRHTVGLNHTAPIWVDAVKFSTTAGCDRRSLNLADLSETIALYGGEFLTGFYVSDAPAFEEWMLGQREQLHQLALHSLSAFAEQALQQAAYQQGLATTQRLLQLEPCYEKAHQLQMALLAASGERDRALIQYEICRRTLSSEIGVEPALETTSMYAQIKSGLSPLLSFGKQPARAVGERVSQVQQEAPSTALKLACSWVSRADPAFFYGREEENRRIYHWIVVEQCRLVMLTGRVGMGKTALASHVAQIFQASDQGPISAAGPAQILWYSCRDMRSAEQLLHDWLKQLDPTYVGSNRDEQEALLLTQLRQRRALLVIDDVERLGDSTYGHGRARGFWQLIEGIVASQHQSCLLLVGRELPPLSMYFEATSNETRWLHLEGLDLDAAHLLLSHYELQGNSILKSRLIEQYDGVPLFLHLAARVIQELGHDTLDVYIDAHAPLFDAVRSVLDADFASLDPLEQSIISRLATIAQPLTLSQLYQTLYHTAGIPDLLAALQRLTRRSLALTTSEGFTIPRLIRSYACARFDLQHQEHKPLCLRQPS
ncbi:MAG: AAA family ATPase [Oscillochloris sp.]|nr:AAA family ATPase [Oscillochloris sp.]